MYGYNVLIFKIKFTGHNILASVKTSFLLKRNGPNDLNKMISKVYGCKMGQGECQVFS